MKLLIIGPSRYKDDGTIFKQKRIMFPRLSMMHIAGLTPKDIEITIVEELVEDINFNVDCDLVGITAFTSQAVRAYDIAEEFRKRGKKVVIGGIHASSLPEEAKQHADSVIIGEADYLWTKVIEDFKNNNLQPTYKSEKHHDLKGLPVPRYDLINKHHYWGRTRPVQASRGCPHNCDFCTVTKFFGGSYRIRPIDEVIRDVKATGSRRIFFVDDNIIANRRYAKELFTRLIPLNIVWSGQSTINIGLYPELCKLAADSGCFFLCIGIESINQNSLASVSKTHNKVNEYHTLLKTMKDNGLSTQLSMIVGLDGDDKNTFSNTIDFIRKVKPCRVAIHVPMPYPGTKMTKALDEDNRILHKDWSKYHEGRVVFTPKLFKREQLEELAYSTRKDLYSVPSIISRTLAQPSRKMLGTLIVSLYDRHFVIRNQWANGG